ncbi:MAG: glycoside hydrolase family 2 TIM barrel-domain containing protein [Paludibacteraceae bacterium]
MLKQKPATLFTLLIFSISISTSQIPAGYKYGNENAPTGNEWESPQDLSLNKEQPRAWFFSFADVESARKVLPENSAYWLSLNGAWKFHWAKHPDQRSKNFFKLSYNANSWDEIYVPSNWNIYGIQPNGDLKYGLPIYVNQPVIFQHKVAVEDWRGGVMRTPPTHWTTYEYRNEVGSYRREFNIPQNWDGREIFINFDGVDSFFYLWINGRYVGFSKNSRNTASFNITPYLQKGNNTVAVEVYRNSDGSFLEAQDMFRLPGIFRTVSLHSTPRVHIRDLNICTDFDNNFQNGTLKIKADIRNFKNQKIKNIKIAYSLYQHELYSDENETVPNVSATTQPLHLAKKSNSTLSEIEITVPRPNKWSAEQPYQYTLVAELKDHKNRTIETVSVRTGFVKVEIKDTKAKDDEYGLAGRYFYVNGKTVKLKGVNRHETNPAVGHALTRKMMENDIMQMKRANINHVRNSHYPTDPYWYYLCNKYGIYLEDEANIESHEYYYGEASLSHPAEWKDAHVARVCEMVHANINNPSIVIWSLGNEAGPGENFVHAYNALKNVDKSRPVQYERNNSIVDMGSNQYPSIAWVNGAVKGLYNIKYPFHISEYAHSMGNACGNLVDYWQAMESTNFFMGGAIWDWVDQSLYNYDKKSGVKYLAYGGDFGDTPNDGQFVMNGIVFGDLEPKPQYFEVKKVYQHIDTKEIDIEKGVFEIFNKYYFKDLSDYKMVWTVFEDGVSVQTGTLTNFNVAPRKRINITIPYDLSQSNNVSEYFIKIQYQLKEKQPWTDRDYVQAEEQLLLKSATERKPPIAEVAKKTAASKPILSPDKNGFRTITGSNFELTFDMKEGTIFNLKYGGETVITDGNGPKLNAIRAFVNNDNWSYKQWFENGLHNLKHRVVSSETIQQSNGSIMILFSVISQAPNAAKITGGTSSGKNAIEELTDKPFGESDFKFTTNQIWTVYPDGSIELQANIVSNKENLILPKLGFAMKISQKFENFSYYGRGPSDNYADRKSGEFIGLYTNKVKNEFVNFPKPQDMGNHEDVRWCALTDNSASGVVFVSNSTMSASALPHPPLDLILASHPYQLPKINDTYLCLDAAVTGLGGNSCGQGAPLEPDRTKARQHNFGFIIRPTNSVLTQTAAVSSSGEVPISIVRSNSGEVKINSDNKSAIIIYSINSRKPQKYSAPIQLQDSGTVNAWYQHNKQIKTSATYSKLKNIQTSVIFASSEEVGEGDASNLTDGDLNTIWHSMYSVTVAKYPHWVDLDAGEVKNIKGFSFLPRQEGKNGLIKDFTIHISSDGKEWGKPFYKGTFDNTQNEKKIVFEKPVNCRYIRFTALSSQNGQDFASGAEITIQAE